LFIEFLPQRERRIRSTLVKVDSNATVTLVDAWSYPQPLGTVYEPTFQRLSIRSPNI